MFFSLVVCDSQVSSGNRRAVSSSGTINEVEVMMVRQPRWMGQREVVFGIVGFLSEAEMRSVWSYRVSYTS